MALAQNDAIDAQSPSGATSLRHSIQTPIPTSSGSQHVASTSSTWQSLNSSSAQHDLQTNCNLVPDRKTPEELASVSQLANKYCLPFSLHLLHIHNLQDEATKVSRRRSSVAARRGHTIRRPVGCHFKTPSIPYFSPAEGRSNTIKEREEEGTRPTVGRNSG